MPVSSIAQILLRLFALNWLFSGLIHSVTIIYVAKLGGSIFYSIYGPLIYLCGGVVLWIAAPRISSLLAKDNDGNATLNGVSEQILYSTVFLGLGLYFALRSFANVFSWIHYFAINRSMDFGFEMQQGRSYYDLFENVMTLCIGVALILSAKTWAKKMCQSKSRPEDMAA